ncbi:MAG TPA: polysaccharide biosynthesis tyrosine autokinase [Candidatus Polarisedimenticolia bacterium]|nr:polysaccharide biosynthesis tyrosine autokinase [Candidatus Polarisedimenticolia bacterium]
METPVLPGVVPDKHAVHLRDYWATIWRWRWTVLATFVIVMTLVTLYTFLQTPVYRATVKVEIQAYSRRVAPVADVGELGVSGYSFFAEERYMNTQFEIIKSRGVSEKVFDRLNLWNDPSYKGMKDPVGAFRSGIIVEPVEMTGIVAISLDGADKEKTTQYVNTLAEVYADRNLEMAQKATSRAVAALLEQMEPLKEKLTRSQEKTYEEASQRRIFVPEDQQKIMAASLQKLQEDLTETQLALSQEEAVLRKVDEVSRAGGSYLSIPEIAKDPIVEGLYRERLGLEQDKQKLLAQYQERHVKVIEKEDQIKRLDEKISRECDRIIGRIKTDFAIKREHEKSTLTQMNQAKGESLELNQRASGFELLRGDTAEIRKIYDAISGRMKEIELSSQLLSNNIRILDKADVPLAPVRPRKSINLLVGFLSGLFLGVGLAFFLEYLDNTVKTTEDVEQYLKLHILSIIPKVNDESSYAVRESLQTLRTGLLFARKNRSSNLVLVTSASPQEGKSTTLVNLAKTMAASGERVALLDCDLRRPTVHVHLELDKRQGMTNYILAEEHESWKEYLKNSKVPNLYAMTSGPLPPNPPDIFGSDRFAQLLSDLKANFDWVFIDSPPVASLTDSVLLASMVDMVTFVIRHNQTDKELVRRCVGHIRNVNANIIGAVLNHVDLERSSYRDYYYVGYYYYGEGRGSKDKGRKPTSLLPARGGSDEVKKAIG